VRARVLAVLGLFLAGVAIAPWTAAVATSCGDGKGDAEIVGRLTSKRDATATFRVETVKAGPHPSANAPLPAPETSLPVYYYDGDARFLHAGQRYDAQIWWDEGRFTAHVTTAEDLCGGGGTLHADGSAIETSLLSRFDPKQVGLVMGTPVVILFALVIWLRRRDRRRRELATARLRAP
jgi:hypothetical protein